MLVTFWSTWFYFRPPFSHCCLASTHSAAMLVTFWSTWFYFRHLFSHCCLASSPLAALMVTSKFRLFCFWPLFSHCYLASFFSLLCCFFLQSNLFYIYNFFLWILYFKRVSSVLNIYNLFRSGVRGFNRREINELQPTRQLQNTRNSEVTFQFLVTYANQLYLPYLTWCCLTGHTLILYLHFLSGTGEKRETSTTQRQSSFAVNSNTGSFKISLKQIT